MKPILRVWVMASDFETLALLGDLPTNWKVARFGDVLDGSTRNGIYKTKEFHGSGAKIVNIPVSETCR